MSMLGIFDCPVMFCDIVIHLLVTQQIKLRNQMYLAPVKRLGR